MFSAGGGTRSERECFVPARYGFERDKRHRWHLRKLIPLVHTNGPLNACSQGQILPHELMLLIADMLASAHLYRTLGTLGLASRALNEDITPKLYGTMLCDRSWRMDWELRDGRLIPKELDQLPLRRWKHAKWVDAAKHGGQRTDEPRLQDTWWKISAGASYAIDSPTFQTLQSVSTSTPATCPDPMARNALAMLFWQSG